MNQFSTAAQPMSKKYAGKSLQTFTGTGEN
jgi:hypothetical protein